MASKVISGFDWLLNMVQWQEQADSPPPHLRQELPPSFYTHSFVVRKGRLMYWASLSDLHNDDNGLGSCWYCFCLFYPFLFLTWTWQSVSIISQSATSLFRKRLPCPLTFILTFVIYYLWSRNRSDFWSFSVWKLHLLWPKTSKVSWETERLRGVMKFSCKHLLFD